MAAQRTRWWFQIAVLVVGSLVAALMVVAASDRPAEAQVADANLGPELIRNGDFSDRGQHWWTSGDRTRATTGALCTTAPAGTTVPWDVQMGQFRVPIVRGADYRLSFDIQGTAASTVRARVQIPRAPFTAIVDEPIDVATNVQSHTLDFTSDRNISAGHVIFHLATGEENRYCIDNVSLRQIGQLPQTPASCTVSRSGNRMTVEWEAAPNDTAVDRFVVQRNVNNQGWAFAGRVFVPRPLVYQESVAPSDQVEYRVMARNAALALTAPRTCESGGAAENLALILANPTRNTQFDDNEFRDVPMADISVSDLTVNADLYNEGLLDTTNSGYFRVKCEVSHFAYDDPIVFPNQPGRAHLHMFFGNTNANAFSTFDSLLNSGTGTCNGADLNRTAYWVPALLDADGNALIPHEIMVYYKNDNFRLNGANELVNPFPDNLRMVVGNGGATTPQTTLSGGPGSQPVISFSCGPAYGSLEFRQALIPDCYGLGQGMYGSNGRAIEMQISFPQCFDEDSGTYLADQSHMSYSLGGYYGSTCPDSHSTDVSSIMYRIFYSPDEYGGALTDLHLSSDVKPDTILPGGTTAHADWFGAWHPDAMDQWVQNCNNTQADCEIGLLGRDPFISLVPRPQFFYPDGYRAMAEDLIQLCPGKVFNPAEPLRSVANCHMN